MAEGKGTGGGEGLSLQTLIVAAAASGVAAVVVSHLWKDGTVIAAAMTPVIVAIMKELIARPMESELVRKPVQQVGRLASGRMVVPGRTGARGSTEEGRVLPPTEERPSRPANGGGPPDAGDAEFTPIRTYGSARRRPPHLKIALITGLIAFVIAAAVLTLPELILGGAISSHHSTTLFGGGGAGKSKDKKGNQQNKTSTQPQQSKQNGQTTPTTPAPSSGTTKPSQTTPQSTTPQKSPQQTTPQQTSPVPTTPTPPAP
jgi:uncharacterized membrane protein YvlD (DUF360 family)